MKRTKRRKKTGTTRKESDTLFQMYSYFCLINRMPSHLILSSILFICLIYLFLWTIQLLLKTKWLKVCRVRWWIICLLKESATSHWELASSSAHSSVSGTASPCTASPMHAGPPRSFSPRSSWAKCSSTCLRSCHCKIWTRSASRNR